MNKQPFYHEVQVLFTSTKGAVSHELQQEIRAVLFKHRRELEIVSGTIEVVESEPEAGDPADLM